ncbi:MAG: pantoate--beta-alanine ligase [Verrucomicrobia bacterium]|nr:pantoate--beta-alanine ligase [Verrucomicrobiota bacterium]
MRIVTSIPQMQRLAKRWQREGVSVGFVPTMGYLHRGHISLVERARKIAGSKGKVVVSIYVNPAQFGPNEDFSKYPRDLERDKKLCRTAKVDLLFVPSNDEMYPTSPEQPFSTFVVEETLSKTMEGESRPTHFRGVTTVVAKLLNIVGPNVAVFGAKDFQQATIIRRMVRDLNIPVRVVVAPTKREPDGLALSSRNKYLSPDERREANILWKSVQMARQMTHLSPNGTSAAKMETRVRRLIEAQPASRVDYVAFFDPESIHPVRVVKRGTQMALAVFIGRTRLIDNAAL